MRHKKLFVTFFVLSACITSLLLGAKLRSEKQKTAKPAPKRIARPTMKATAKPAGLPEQPRCDNPALPDITVEKVEFSGPSGPFRPNQQYTISVVLKNIGQCQTGVFLVKLQVRVQVPSQNKDERDVIVGSKKVYSIQPCKTRVSTGTSTVSFDYTTGDFDWAQYTFTAIADYTNHIEEFDEANNEKTSPDMVVDTYRL